MSYNSAVEPKRQATFEYGFMTNEAFSGRPFGLTVLLNYKDAVSLSLLIIKYHKESCLLEALV